LRDRVHRPGNVTSVGTRSRHPGRTPRSPDCDRVGRFPCGQCSARDRNPGYGLRL